MDKLNLARWQVICAGIASLVLTVGLARFSYTPMLPLMLDQTSLNKLDGGYLATLNYMGYMSGALLASFLPRLSQKYQMYRTGLVVAAISTPAMGLTENVPLWLVLRYVSGVSSTAGLLLASGLIMNWLSTTGRKTELGLHFTGMGLGIAVTGLLVLGLNSQLDWAGQWYAMGLIGLVCFVPAWQWMPAPGDNSAAMQGQNKATLMPPSHRWRVLMIAAYLCAGFGYVISATFIVAIVEEFPQLNGRGSWVWVLVGVAAMPSTFIWDRLAARLGGFEALILAYALQIVGILLPALNSQLWAGLASAVLYGGTFVGIVSLTLSIAGRRFPGNPAKAMARMTLSYGVAQIAAPAVAGLLANSTGSYRGSLYMAAAFMVLGMGLLQALRSEAT